MPEATGSILPVDPQELRQFLLGLGEAMTDASESVSTIHAQLDAIATAYALPDTDLVVLPTLVIVQTGGSAAGRVSMSSVAGNGFNFDQIGELYSLLYLAERAAIEPRVGIIRLSEIRRMKPRFGWVIRTIGHALLAAGLSLLLVPTWEGAALSFVLGIIVGLAKLSRSSSLQYVLPTAAAFVCALVVFSLAPFVAFGDPLRLLIAPIATFLPGAMLTTATVELASRQMIAGASRLVAGFVELALLAFGILAAGAVVGISSSAYTPLARAELLPWWVSALGVAIYAVGIFFYLSVPTATFGWVVLVLFIAYAGQSLGSVIAGPTLSGFIGAIIMTPAVLLVARLEQGAPSQITFLPAFWLLVPGASGLVGLTEAATLGSSANDFMTALVTVMSIALGVLIGTALFQFALDSRRVLRAPGSD